ncbi:MAG: hypothetical protein ACUVR4_09535 [Anaerolineae bacterium]
MSAAETIYRDLGALSPADQALVQDFIAFLRWRAGQGPAGFQKPIGPARPWHFNFLEHFAEADVRTAARHPGSSGKDTAGMEVKIGEASVGGEWRPALWQHPPISGEALAEFHVPIPAGLRDLRLRFSIGIRDGAQGAEQLVAFRIKIDGWQVWSRAAYPRAWQPYEIALPFQAGNILRLAFATDSLGEHQWAWAAWGEPELVGSEA